MLCSFVQLYIYALFEYTKAVMSTVENVGGGICQDPPTEVTHLGLNSPPLFSLVFSGQVINALALPQWSWLQCGSCVSQTLGQQPQLPAVLTTVLV